MNAVLHISVGLGTVAMLNPGPVTLEVATAGILGALFCDADDERSWLGKKLWPLAFGLRKTAGHRTMTHSLTTLPIWLICVLITCYLLGLPLWATSQAFTIGYLTHIALDMLSGKVKLLWPLKFSIGTGVFASALAQWFLLFVSSGYMGWFLYKKGITFPTMWPLPTVNSLFLAKTLIVLLALTAFLYVLRRFVAQLMTMGVVVAGIFMAFKML